MFCFLVISSNMSISCHFWALWGHDSVDPPWKSQKLRFGYTGQRPFPSPVTSVQSVRRRNRRKKKNT